MLGGCATEGGHVETKTAKKARPAAALDGTAACPRGAALLGGNVSVPDIEKLPGTKLVADLKHELAQLRQQVKEQNKLVEELRAAARRRPPPRKRQFFTSEFHCQGASKFETLKNYFGLTNGWKDFVIWVTSFHVDDDLVESHSDDIRSHELTPFEQCLVAKAYVPSCLLCYVCCP